MFKWLKSVGSMFSSQNSGSSLVKIDDDGFFSDDISVSIEDMVTGEEGEDVSKLHVISLTEFHQSLGKLWDSREATIFRIVEAVLRDRIGPGNRWEHKSPEVYIMLFLTLPEVEADALAFEISEEIGMKIIGERFDGARRPLIRVAGVDPKDAMKEDGTFDIQALEKVGRSGEAAGDALAGTNNAPSSGGHIPGGKKTESKPQPTISGGPEWQKNPHAHEETETNWQKSAHSSAPHGSTDWEKQAVDKRAKLDPNWVSMTEKKAQQHEKAKTPYETDFIPCWLLSEESLNHYRIRFNWIFQNDERLSGTQAYQRLSTEEKISKTDMWILQQSTKGLFPLLTRQIVTPVFVPVHSFSLRAPFISEYIDMLGKMSEGLRMKYIILDILDDGHWTEESLTQLLNDLKGYCKEVSFSLSPQVNFAQPPCSGFSWVLLNLDDVGDQQAFDEVRLKTLIEQGHQSSSKVGILGVAQREQFAPLIKMGADLLGGPALVKPTDALRPPFKLQKERLLKSAGV